MPQISLQREGALLTIYKVRSLKIYEWVLNFRLLKIAFLYICTSNNVTCTRFQPFLDIFCPLQAQKRWQTLTGHLLDLKWKMRSCLRGQPQIFTICGYFTTFWNFAKKKSKIFYKLRKFVKAYRGISLWIMHWMMQIALWCGRYAASVVEPRWKMERGDIWFSQVHAPDGMNTFEGPSSGAPYTF